MIFEVNNLDTGVPVQDLCAQVNASKIRVSEQITEGIYLSKQTANILNSSEQRTFFIRFLARLTVKLLRVMGGKTPIAGCDEYLTLTVKNRVLKHIGRRNLPLDDWVIQRISTQTSALGLLKSLVIINSVDSTQTFTLILFTKLAFTRPVVTYFNIS
jgi:hypothetical protein